MSDCGATGGNSPRCWRPRSPCSSRQDPEATLRHWHGLLENGGGLYLTVFMPYAELLGDLPENEWYEDHKVTLPDGRRGLLETRHRLDHARQTVEREHRYSLSGDPPLTHESRQSIRWIEHGQIA